MADLRQAALRKPHCPWDPDLLCSVGFGGGGVVWVGRRTQAAFTRVQVMTIRSLNQDRLS